MLTRLLRYVARHLVPQAQLAYAQFGEDLILSHLFAERGIRHPTYLDIGAILTRYFRDKAPNFISLDTEGLDLEILQSTDFSRFRPEAVCVETADYDDKQHTLKPNAIAEYMLGRNYVVYADTRVNTIFCRRDVLGT
jgi:hypothetical protein